MIEHLNSPSSPPLASVDHASLLLFDGVCNFCNGSVAFIIRHDPAGSLRFASLQSETGQAILRQHGLDPANLFSIVLVENGQAHTRSSAAVRVARHLTFPWKLATLFWLIPSPLRDVLYNFVAKNRYRWFGKQEACMVPTPDVRARFLK